MQAINMKGSKIAKKIALVTPLILLLFLTTNSKVFSAGEIITNTVIESDIQSTQAHVSGEVGAPTGVIRNVGFTQFFDVLPGTDLGECNYLDPTPEQSTNGYVYSHVFSLDKTELTPGTIYYFAACGKNAGGEVFFGELLDFVTKTGNVYTITTHDAQELSSNNYRLKVSANSTVGLDRFGFGLTNNTEDLINVTGNNPPGPEDLSINGCSLYANSVNANSYQFQKDFELEYGQTYYYQGCAMDDSGQIHKGEVKTLTVVQEGGGSVQNERNENCRIDYVEFLPFNSSSANAVPGNSQFEAFVYGQGKEVTLKFHPKNANDCISVPIHTLEIQSSWVTLQGEDLQYDHNKDIKVLVANTAGGGSRKFNESGQFEIKLVAGDTESNCKYRLAAYPDTEICHSYVKITYGTGVGGTGIRIFKSKAVQGDIADQNHDYPSNSDDSSKGTINYARRQTKPWKLWETGDPQGTDTIVAVYELESPCYVAPGGDLGNGEQAGNTGGYLENCYELLAPIPGIGDTVKGDRVAIGNLKDYKLGDYINTLFQVALGILMVIAVVMIVVAGVEYMTVESFYGKSDAKKRIMGAVTGLILALGIFLILRTINPQLLEINFGSGIDIVSIEIDTPPERQGDGSYVRPTGEKLMVAGEIIKFGDQWPPPNANLVDIRQDLAELGITINAQECSTVGQGSCTSTYFESGTATSLISRLENLKTECSDCSYVITGGSEVWLHSTHRTNKPIVDIRESSPINQAISGQSTFIGSCRKNTHESGLGITYSLSEDGSCPWNPAKHWHIAF
ncbi:hypothetical protein KC929_03175 [Patescibacteria group bacterium]|nr:hypothetical protein [Patescibacteria group bacterium]